MRPEKDLILMEMIHSVRIRKFSFWDRQGGLRLFWSVRLSSSEYKIVSAESVPKIFLLADKSGRY